MPYAVDVSKPARPGIRKLWLGSKLRTLRESSGVDLETVLEETDWSRYKLSRVETAQMGVSVPDVRMLCGLYKADDVTTEKLVQLARNSRKRGWWRSYEDALSDFFADYVELETEASSITNYEIDLIPGLLQTGEYAKAVIEAWEPGLEQETVARRKELRLERQSRLEESGLTLWAIIDEAALRRRVGSSEVMERQLDHIAAMARRPNITVQVLPFGAGAHVAQGTSFTMLEFDALDPVVYVETLTSALYLEDAPEVSRYRLAVEHLRATGLDPRASIEILNKE
ncbi:helix-turn-helix transcriptional regulator [Saccharopolyspora halophila]|uniref:Helix-turn-helix transcriptional regulator n=1 Tax=Saccharopolyspora halophila TaxID=405551 RepID=A0ABP5TRY7_9PSEU